MKNPARIFSREEHELLREALKILERWLVEIEPHLLDEALLSKTLGRDIGGALREQRARKLTAAKVLREKLTSLEHHDHPLPVGEDQTNRWCLACWRRHTPHCATCQGCLPAELPE